MTRTSLVMSRQGGTCLALEDDVMVVVSERTGERPPPRHWVCC